MFSTQFIGVRDFRQNIFELYKNAQKNNIRYIVLRNSKPIFDMRPLQEEDASLERLLATTKKARADAKAGRVHSLESIEKELGII